MSPMEAPARKRSAFGDITNVRHISVQPCISNVVSLTFSYLLRQFSTNILRKGPNSKKRAQQKLFPMPKSFERVRLSVQREQREPKQAIPFVKGAQTLNMMSLCLMCLNRPLGSFVAHKTLLSRVQGVCYSIKTTKL